MTTSFLPDDEAMRLSDLRREAEGRYIAGYLGEPYDENVHSIGLIHTCVRIIGAFEPGMHGRSDKLVQAAAESIVDWANDYGAKMAMVS